MDTRIQVAIQSHLQHQLTTIVPAATPLSGTGGLAEALYCRGLGGPLTAHHYLPLFPSECAIVFTRGQQACHCPRDCYVNTCIESTTSGTRDPTQTSPIPLAGSSLNSKPPACSGVPSITIGPNSTLIPPKTMLEGEVRGHVRTLIQKTWCLRRAQELGLKKAQAEASKRYSAINKMFQPLYERITGIAFLEQMTY